MTRTGSDSRLEPAERDKLAKLLGLLGSDFDGERAVAARLASEFLQRHGLTWSELLTGTPQRDEARGDDWRALARRCCAHADALTAWERQFCRDLLGFVRISPKQRAVLTRLAAKVAAA
jgi:enoyl-CoA hydratase/carnithine racemase